MIRTYLLDNQSRLAKATRHLTKQRDKALADHRLFESDVVTQYVSECSKIIVDDVTKSLACSAEDVMIVLESMDLEGLLE